MCNNINSQNYVNSKLNLSPHSLKGTYSVFIRPIIPTLIALGSTYQHCTQFELLHLYRPQQHYPISPHLAQFVEHVSLWIICDASQPSTTLSLSLWSQQVAHIVSTKSCLSLTNYTTWRFWYLSFLTCTHNLPLVGLWPSSRKLAPA